MNGLARPVAALALLALAAVSCDGEPGTPVDDPRGHLVEALGAAEFRGWWAEYADRGEDFVGLVVDDFVASLPQGLPTDTRGLERLMPRLEGRYRSMILSEEHRERLLRAAEARFAEPPMAMIQGRVPVALLDYHFLPGRWASTGRGVSEVWKDSPAIARLGEFDHDVLVASLRALAERFPDAHRYQVRARYHFGASSHSLTVQVDRGGPIVRHADVATSFTDGPVDWDALLAGEVLLGELTWHQPMEGDAGPSFSNAHPEPLPMAD